jgi:uncharacterized protein (TIGR03066 family)
MFARFFAPLLVLSFFLAGSVSAQTAADLKGKWIVKKSEEAPQGTTFEFDGAGKVTLTMGKTTMQGSYTYEGDQLTIKIKHDGREKIDVRTVKTLSPRTLITENAKKKSEEMHKE